MSLINEALKKAQRERSRQEASAKSSLLREGNPAETPEPAGGNRRKQDLPLFKLIFGLIIAGSVLASAIAFMLFLYMQVSSSPPSELPTANSTSEKSTGTEVVLTPARDGSREPGEVHSTGETNTLSVSLQEASRNLENAPDLEVTRVASPPLPGKGESLAAETSAGSGETVHARPAEIDEPSPTSDLQVSSASPVDYHGNEEPPAPGLKGSAKDPGSHTQAAADKKSLSSGNKNDRIENYIGNATIAGIRLSGADSKVVLNNRVYRLQEWVLDTDIKLKIIGIEKNHIHFEDEHGTRYTKRF